MKRTGDNSALYFHKDGSIMAWADTAGTVQNGNKPVAARCAAYREYLAKQVEYLHADHDAPDDERTVRLGLGHGVIVGAVVGAAILAGFCYGNDKGREYAEATVTTHLTLDESERVRGLVRAGWTLADALAEVAP